MSMTDPIADFLTRIRNGQTSGKPVVELAANWTEQPGFPVVFVSAAGEGANRTLRLEQSRFTVNYPDAAPLTWKVPVTLANTATVTVWLTTPAAKFSVPPPPV